MTVQLSPQATSSLHKMATTLKVKENILLERALKHYADSLEQNINLQMEFNTWDDLSDESLDNFEKMLATSA